MIAQEYVVRELSGTVLSSVVKLCHTALDLPEDAVEAAQIVERLYQAPSLTPQGSPIPGQAPTGLPSSRAEPGEPAEPAARGGRGEPRERRTAAFAAWRPGADDAPVGVVLTSLGFDDASVGFVDLLAVHPDVRRRGIGRALLRAAEEALGRLGAAEVRLAGNPPNYAWPGIDVRYTPAVCAAAALGYEHRDTFWNMTADLSAEAPGVRETAPAEARLAAAGVQVRRATADDLEPLCALVERHFTPSWAGEIADSVDRAGAGCHIAVRDGRPIGFAAYGSSRPSWFGPMGTDPAAQGSGVGAVLLRRCLRDQREAGLRSAQIGWVGPVPFYSRVAGARIERVFFGYHKRL